LQIICRQKLVPLLKGVDIVKNPNFETISRVLEKVNALSPAQREIMCLCAVAYEAGRSSAASSGKPVQ